MHAVLALRRYRQENCQFKASQSFIALKRQTAASLPQPGFPVVYFPSELAYQVQEFPKHFQWNTKLLIGDAIEQRRDRKTGADGWEVILRLQGSPIRQARGCQEKTVKQKKTWLTQIIPHNQHSCAYCFCCYYNSFLISGFSALTAILLLQSPSVEITGVSWLSLFKRGRVYSGSYFEGTIHYCDESMAGEAVVA